MLTNDAKEVQATIQICKIAFSPAPFFVTSSACLASDSNMHLLSLFATIARVFVGICKKAKAKIEKPNSSNSGAVIQKRAFKWYWWSSFPPSWQDHCFHGTPYFFRWNAAEILKGDSRFTPCQVYTFALIIPFPPPPLSRPNEHKLNQEYSCLSSHHRHHHTSDRKNRQTDGTHGNSVLS